MSSIRLTYLQKVGLEERLTHQGLLGPSLQRYQLRCPSLATLAGPNPTGLAGTLPKHSTKHYHRTAQNHPSLGPQNGCGSLEHRNASPTTNRCGLRQGPSSPNQSTLLEEPCRHRLKQPSWRSTAKAQMNRFPDAISSTDALQALLEYPWATKGQWKVFPEGKLAPTVTPPTAETCLRLY